MEDLPLPVYAQLYKFNPEITEQMAECTVVFVLDKITFLLEAKVVQLHGVKHEIVYIKDELERMIAFLGVTDTVEDGDAEVKVWVKQVRDVAYDIEDTIDEFMLLVPDEHQSKRFCGFQRRFCFSIRNLKSQQRIADEIQSIKSRVHSIAELTCVVIDEGAMPHLERLVIQRCNLLERLPSGIECLVNLKYLEFFDMTDEFISSFHPDRQGEDYCKVAHVPEVYSTYWKDGFWEVNSLEEKHGNNTSREPGTAGAAKITGRRNSL